MYVIFCLLNGCSWFLFHQRRTHKYLIFCYILFLNWRIGYPPCFCMLWRAWISGLFREIPVLVYWRTYRTSLPQSKPYSWTKLKARLETKDIITGTRKSNCKTCKSCLNCQCPPTADSNWILLILCISLARFPNINNSFHESQSLFRAALCDSFNTPLALEILTKLVSKTNVYINTQGRNLNHGVVERVARWTGKMLRMFGLGEGSAQDPEIGWGEERSGDSVNVCYPYQCRFASFINMIFGIITLFQYFAVFYSEMKFSCLICGPCLLSGTV